MLLLDSVSSELFAHCKGLMLPSWVVVSLFSEVVPLGPSFPKFPKSPASCQCGSTYLAKRRVALSFSVPKERSFMSRIKRLRPEAGKASGMPSFTEKPFRHLLISFLKYLPSGYHIYKVLKNFTRFCKEDSD